MIIGGVRFQCGGKHAAAHDGEDVGEVFFDERYQVYGIVKSLTGRVPVFQTFRRIALKGKDVFDAVFIIPFEDGSNIIPARFNAGEV